MMEAYGELGVLISLKDVYHLNNAFQILWRNAVAAKNRKQIAELEPIMAGWEHDFNKWRTSYWARATEWGELSNWQKKYQALRNKFARQGTKITAPYVAPGKTPGDVQVDIPEEELEKARAVGMGVIGIGLLGALGIGLLLWRMRRA